VLYAADELQKPIKLVLLEKVVANMQICRFFAATTHRNS
jgi:hypothetical protein